MVHPDPDTCFLGRHLCNSKLRLKCIKEDNLFIGGIQNTVEIRLTCLNNLGSWSECYMRISIVPIQRRNIDSVWRRKYSLLVHM